MCLGDEISDREISRRWGMEWKSFASLKQGARQVPRLDQLEVLAREVLGVDAELVFRVGSGVPAERVAAERAAERVGPSTVYDQMPAACVVIDRDGTICSVNASAAQLVPAVVAGRPAAEVFGAPDPARLPVARAFLTGRVEQQVAVLHDAAGRRRYVHRVAGPVVAGGRVQRVVELLSDVTEAIERGDVRVVALWRQATARRPRAPEGPDRRAMPRAHTSFAARFALDGRRDTAVVANLCVGGLFLETDAAACAGAPIEVDWTLPGDGCQVRARGEVAWIRAAVRGDRPAGLGVRIVALDPGFAAAAGGDR